MSVVVSLHDVAPATWSASAQWLDRVEARGLGATLLVVPGPFLGACLDDDPAFVAWLHAVAGRGHELALHGWSHTAVADPDGDVGRARRLYGRVVARGCAEFLQLGPVEAARRIELGGAVLRRHGIHAVGFTPPGWLASGATDAALRAAGFVYTTTQWGVKDLRNGRRRRIAATSQRPGSRLSTPAAVVTAAAGGAAFGAGRAVRIALHPADLSEARSVAANERLLDHAATRRSFTYRELVDSWSVPI